MSEQKNLKFIHLASGADAQHSDANVGAIIFEPKSGRIAVDGATGLEYYGGNIKNATFADQILTLSFNKGNDIKLDFSDTASASGVNAIMKAHADRIKALEGTINGDKDNVGLVSKVDTNTESISQNTLDIAANKSAIDKINSQTDGILVTAKNYTDTKVGELKATVDSNSGKITALEGKHADGKTVAQEITDKVGEITGTVKKYVDDAVKTVTDDATDLSGRVTTLEGTVGKPAAGSNAATGLHKDIADLAKLHADKTEGGKMTVKEEVDAGIAKVVAGAPDRLDTLKEIADWIGSDTTGATQMATDINDLKKKVGASTDPAKADGTVYARIAKNVADITALTGRHSGDLTVAEEVAKGITGIAEASLTGTNNDVSVTVTTKSGSVSGVTVNAKALADKVTANTNKITTLEGVVGKPAAGSDAATGLVKDVADNKAAIANNASNIAKNTTSINGHTTKITALEKLHGTKDGAMMTVADEADARIAAIPSASLADDNNGVSVTVSTAAGKVSGVTVDASTLATRVGTLETTVGNSTSGLVKTVNTHTEDITNIKTNLGDSGAEAGTGSAFARIKALENAQSSGSLMWSVWE